MLTTSSLWLFIIPFLIAAALPGPAQGALVAQVLSRGGRAALLFMFGMAVGNAIWLVAAIFGLSELAVRFHDVFVVVKWLGVAYLLFIAWKLWIAPPIRADEAAGSSRAGLVSGMLLTLGNPKAVVFFGSILPHAFDMTRLTGLDAALILVIGLGLDLMVQASYLTVASRARGLLRSARHIRMVNRSAAGLMTSAAALIATRS